MHYRVRYSLDFDPKIRSGQVCTLISTICKVNISFLSESEVKIFDRGHGTDNVVL